jgi:tetratricopeptide (TPR) repeat protein
MLLATLASVVYKRGFGWRLGAAPAALEGEYLTEEAWIVGEIVRDIAEVSAYPSPAPVDLRIGPATEEAGEYAVYMHGLRAPIELDLRRELWNPAAFAAVARAVMAMDGGRPVNAAKAPAARAGAAAAKSPYASSAAVHPALLDLTPASIVNASVALSRLLAVNMREAQPHESAALVLGAFALRESAGRFSDTRWAMNRMTAHLAMAEALGGGSSLDGQLAEALLLALADHQTRALGMLGRLTTPDASKAVDAWIRALRIRITQDWRAIPLPSRATLLEKHEYFRARRATVRAVKGNVELQRLGEAPSANWMRLMQDAAPTADDVEEGWLLTSALDWEVDEYEGVYQRMHDRPVGWNVSGALNVTASRLVGKNGPEVLPWSAWAEFAQRHLSMFISRADDLYFRGKVSASLIDEEKRRLQTELGTLSAFRSATIWWTKGASGMNEAIDRAVANPQRVSATVWSFMETGARFEPVRRGMPSPASWFLRPSTRTMYEAPTRIKHAGHPRVPAEISAMMRDAPYDYDLASEFLTTKYGEKPPYAEVMRALGMRKDYDLRVLHDARRVVEDDAERLSLLRRSCEVSAPECMALASEHAQRGREDEAAASFERAFADPSVDAVALANVSGWLVNHYFRQRRLDPALQLAERSAKTGSFAGLVTLASLYERLERWDDAEEVYREAADRYDNPSQLLGFYYRAVHNRKQMEFDEAWRAALAEVFPNGLTRDAGEPGRPAIGVIVTRNDELAKNAGLQPGDIIVALEGWRVENIRQYAAINAFFETDLMKLTAWRRKRIELTVRAPGRLLGSGFRSYPVQDRGEK